MIEAHTLLGKPKITNLILHATPLGQKALWLVLFLGKCASIYTAV